MSLPRGSHSNCGSQPLGWEPFFFTLQQPALVFLYTKKSALVLRFSGPPTHSVYALRERLYGA